MGYIQYSNQWLLASGVLVASTAVLSWLFEVNDGSWLPIHLCVCVCAQKNRMMYVEW